MKGNSNINKLLDEAWALRRKERYVEAQNLVKEAQNLCKDDDNNSLGRIFHVYMQIESDRNNYSKAEEFCQKSLEYYKKANNLDKIAHATRHIADLQNHLGKDTDSERNYRESISIYRDNPNIHIGDLANALRGFGLMLEKRGKREEAVNVWKETKELYSSIHLQEGVDEANQKLKSLL